MPDEQRGAPSQQGQDQRPEVIKVAFLGAGSFGATVVSILGFGAGTDAGARSAIGVVSVIFAAAMLNAAIYVSRR